MSLQPGLADRLQVSVPHFLIKMVQLSCLKHIVFIDDDVIFLCVENIFRLENVIVIEITELLNMLTRTGVGLLQPIETSYHT